jgi:hypothetical protein
MVTGRRAAGQQGWVRSLMGSNFTAVKYWVSSVNDLTSCGDGKWQMQTAADLFSGGREGIGDGASSGPVAVGDLDLLGHWVDGSAVGGSQVCQGV